MTAVVLLGAVLFLSLKEVGEHGCGLMLQSGGVHRHPVHPYLSNPESLHPIWLTKHEPDFISTQE